MSDCFRILSPTAILGYGFPEASFKQALSLDLDLIAVDAGSVDAGPYYLGSDKHYVAAAALERDLRLMIRGALQQQCPCIIGSAGFSGAVPQSTDVNALIKRIISEECADSAKLAFIPSDIPGDKLLPYADALDALGRMPELTSETLLHSNMVGQMGIEPIITALTAGAQFIVCGRAYDPAVFAAAAIHQGYDPGIAFHAGKILECGAIACTPGSGSDCLIAELYQDQHAEFYPLSDKRACTIKSIAAHSLYEKTRPDFFHLPGGCLSIQDTEFFQVDNKRAGIRGSKLISAAPSIKIEGARAIGKRQISLIELDSCSGISNEIRIYGRNGVEASFDENEMGLVCVVQSDNAKAAHDVLANLRSGLLHFGYPGRISTAGNLAFPCSPSDIDCIYQERPSSVFIAGTRDPIFIKQWPHTKIALEQQVQDQIPDLFEQCDITWTIADNEHPIAFLSGADQVQAIQELRQTQGLSLENLELGLVYEWSVHHLVHDQKLLATLFPIHLAAFNGTWHDLETLSCDWSHSVHNNFAQPDEQVAHIQSQAQQITSKRLIDTAEVIRSKNAGINEITYDILFSNSDDFESALVSGAFTAEQISSVLGIPQTDIIGCFQYPIVNAIKITCHRSCLAGSPQDRDVFGAQQQSKLLSIEY